MVEKVSQMTMIGKTPRMNTNKSFQQCLYEHMATLSHTKGVDSFGRNVKVGGVKYVRDR